MCQSVNLFWKIAVSDIGCLSAYSCGGHNINLRLQIGSPFNTCYYFTGLKRKDIENWPSQITWFWCLLKFDSFPVTIKHEKFHQHICPYILAKSFKDNLSFHEVYALPWVDCSQTSIVIFTYFLCFSKGFRLTIEFVANIAIIKYTIRVIRIISIGTTSCIKTLPTCLNWIKYVARWKKWIKARCFQELRINSFVPNAPFLYPQKRSGNCRFSHVFKG